MKKIKFINSLIAVMFMAVALAACSSSSKDDDDDDDDEKSEKVDKKDKEKSDEKDKEKSDEKGIDIPASSGAEGFCNTLTKVTEAIVNATSEDEIEALQDRFKDSLKSYKEDNTPLTEKEKEDVAVSLSMFMGAVMEKAVDFGYVGQDMTDEELYDTGFQMGQQIRAMVDSSNSLAEVCANMKNMM